MPGVRTLDNPAARLSSNASDERLLSATTDVRRDASRSDGGFGVRVVVAFVEAQMLGTPWTARTTQDNRVERARDEPLVVHVGPGDLGRKRHATTIRENVALDPALRAIRRVRAGQIPPFGAFTIALSSEAHVHWMPRRLS